MWFFLAAGASLFWGLTYVFDEQLYKHVSVPTILAVHSTMAALVATLIALSMGVFKSDVVTLTSSPRLLTLFLVSMVCAVIAGLLIGYSISGRSATLAGLIEISYPLFIALFSYLIFKEGELTIATAIGGLLVFSGISVIYWFGR